MSGEIDHDGATPVYLQLADILRQQILDGELLPDRAVPSETELEQRYALARGTIRKAVRVLRDEGFVVTVRGRGSFVAPRANWPQDTTS